MEVLLNSCAQVPQGRYNKSVALGMSVWMSWIGVLDEITSSQLVRKKGDIRNNRYTALMHKMYSKKREGG